MSLLFESMEPCVFLERTRRPDGSGGYINTWTDGAEFRAAIAFDNSMEARIGTQSGVTSVYTVTTDTAVRLEYHDAFRRVSDGKVFRVTSDGEDKKTPAAASFRVMQVTAEEWNPV